MFPDSQHLPAFRRSLPKAGLPSSSTHEGPLFEAKRRVLIPKRSSSLRTLFALILREMSTRYGKSLGGYTWAFVEPVATIFILALGFSMIIRAPSLGESFFLFYASGYLPFFIYQQVSVHVARAIEFSRPLMAYPTVTWIDAVLSRFLLNMLTSLCVTFVTLTAVLISIDSNAIIDGWPMLRAVTMAGLLGLGVGVMNCLLIGLYPTWAVIWSILTRPLFLASGILFTLGELPKVLADVLWFNPLIHIVGEMRDGIYVSYAPDYVSIPFVVGIALGLIAVGFLLMRAYGDRILERT